MFDFILHCKNQIHRALEEEFNVKEGRGNSPQTHV